MSNNNTNYGGASNLPIVSICAAVVLVIFAGFLVIFTPSTSINEAHDVIALVITLVPTLIAAAFAERASRDIRNGVVADKAKEGATQALIDTGVAQAQPTTEEPPQPSK